MKKFLIAVVVGILVFGFCVSSFALTNEEWAEVIGTGIGLVAGVVLPSVKGADGQPLVKDATAFQVGFYATISGNLVGRMIGAFLPDKEIDGKIVPAGGLSKLPLEEDPTVLILYNDTSVWRIEVGVGVDPREIDPESGLPAEGEQNGKDKKIQFTLFPGGGKWVSLPLGVEHKINAQAYTRTQQGFIKVFRWEATYKVNPLGQGKTIRYQIEN